MTTEHLFVLVIDDDRAHRAMLRAVLSDLGAMVREAADGRAGLEVVANHGNPDLILLDMRMPGMDGLATLEALQAARVSAPTVVLTAHADLDDAVRAMKLGAHDYLRKPIDVASLAALLQSIGPHTADQQEAPLPPLPEDVVAESGLFLDVLRDLARVARSDAPVLLRGETGTGKEVLADLVHRWSGRSHRPFVALNVAALPESLAEAELFGVRRGAFTGADRDRTGRFEDSDGGTLFLDEIGELPGVLQPKLLRVLQEREITRLGDNSSRAVDFRLVTATNRDLETEAESGGFRADLYYRLAVVEIEIPPLRERPEDVIALARRFAHLEGGGKRLTPSTERLLRAYAWPGNVRELHNVVLRASIVAAGDTVLPDNLPPNLRANPAADALESQPTEDDPRTLAEIEKAAILAALERHDGNRSEAARNLGISRRKLLYRLKEYGEQA